MMIPYHVKMIEGVIDLNAAAEEAHRVPPAPAQRVRLRFIPILPFSLSLSLSLLLYTFVQYVRCVNR
jgi:hypothetical protein